MECSFSGIYEDDIQLNFIIFSENEKRQYPNVGHLFGAEVVDPDPIADHLNGAMLRAIEPAGDRCELT